LCAAPTESGVKKMFGYFQNVPAGRSIIGCPKIGHALLASSHRRLQNAIVFPRLT
jgi:hypothetical protein